jgi:hypothetical protein
MASDARPHRSVDTPPLAVGRRLPPLRSHAANGEEVRWRDPVRGSLTAVFLDSNDREGDREYLQSLEAAVPAFKAWDGRLIVVMPGEEKGAEQAADSLALVTRTNGEAEHCGVRKGEDAVIIADRWGQIYHIARGQGADALPDPSQIEEWFRFIDTQCPECGVPDEP